MIQDMLGNEFYVGVYKDGSVWRTNKFMDVSHFPMPSSSSSSSSDMQVWERRLLYCVPVSSPIYMPTFFSVNQFYFLGLGFFVK